MKTDSLFICETNWSVSYRIDNYFIKYLKYLKLDKLKREVKYSTVAYNNSVNTPKLINYGYSEEKKLYFIKYEFLTLDKISNNINNNILTNIKEILYRFNKINVAQIDNIYWENDFLEEFRIALNITKEYLYNNHNIFYNATRSIQYLNNLKTDSFIHGDFSLSNILLENKNICVVDFEHGTLGPKDWDLSYLITTSLEDNYLVPNFTVNYDKELVKIISGIRLGRSIIKYKNIEKRLRNFLALNGYLQ